MAQIIHERLRGRKAVAQRERRVQMYPICLECLAEGIVKATDEIDHTIALANGGEDTDDNCQGLCTAHHVDKTNRDMGRTVKQRIGEDGWPV